MVWVGDGLVGEDGACVPALDHGLLVGDGVFESVQLSSGRLFALRRHLDRLERSCAGLGIALPDRQLLERACDEVVEANRGELADGRLRLTVTAGLCGLGSGRAPAVPTLVVALGPLGGPAGSGPSEWETARVMVVPWPRNERGALAGLKTTSYAENVIALAYATERGATEAVFANTAGNLCEGTGSNVFIASSGRLVTPPLSAGCLDGVTRALVIEESGAREADVPVEALRDCDEAFITSTNRGVQPIAGVDGKELPQVPGPLTRGAAEAFAALQARTYDP